MTDTITLTLVVGNPKPASRTLGVANDLGRRLAGWMDRRGSRADVTAVDLASVAPRLFDWEDGEVDQLVARLRSSRLAVLASPTYKASYTGLLKAFLDRVPGNGLAGVVAVPLMTGAGAGHALAPEVHLRPVLIELGASCPTRGLYVQEAELGDPSPTLDGWLSAHEEVLGRALGFEAR